MAPFIVKGFNFEAFINTYWQKQPCVIKQFMVDFEDPIDEHELAGLAQEPEIDCRLVAQSDGQWLVTQGPIDDFEPLCKGAWTLLVQGVDKYIEEVDALVAPVSKIGNWRLDDVMVSFSAPEAGVGPHIDQYDVFIVQGKGKRRWQVGTPGNFTDVLPHPLLKQIEGFEPIIDECLQPGDAIYIPPKHPHNGTALEPCLNYSIGFRAPTNLEMLHGILDEGDTLIAYQQRYEDRDIASIREPDLPSESITKTELSRLKQSIVDLLDTDAAEYALMRYLSRQSLPETTDQSSECISHQDASDNLFEKNGTLHRNTAVKPIYNTTRATAGLTDKPFTFFIDGRPYAVDASLTTPVQSMLASAHTSLPLVCELEVSQKHLLSSLVAELVNDGFYFFSQDTLLSSS
ncbi:cupin domain-containing protein [Ningiella sp. W23]|uniref:cupin domain-containing protein n=1 Tax=Ningiella sp. W23 TaxID=3023715 RepID=UPI0037570AAB